MPGHVLLADRELVGQRLDCGLAVRAQVLDDPNAKGLSEHAQRMCDRFDLRLGNRLRRFLPRQLEVSYRVRSSCSSRAVQNFRGDGSPFRA